MSRASKLTLAGFSTFALSTIGFVHYTQQAEKAVRPPPTTSFPFIISGLRFYAWDSRGSEFTGKKNKADGTIGNASRRSSRYGATTH